MSLSTAPAPTTRRASLVLLETSGNQRFIFDTNRRRENVGASQLIWAVGSTWFDEALRTLALRRIDAPHQLAPDAVLPLVAASGKVLCLVGSPDVGRAIVRELTQRALRDAPGLDLAGYVGGAFDLDTTELADQVADAHRRFQSARAARPGPERRFQRLPPADVRPSSGLPAATLRAVGGTPEARSAPSAAKFDAADAAMTRLAPLLGVTGGLSSRRRVIARLMQQLEGDDLRRAPRRAGAGARGADAEIPSPVEDVAVIHADGNGLGALFLGLGARAQGETLWDRNADYARLLAGLSAAIDTASTAAFRAAQASVRQSSGLPAVLPLVLGGDDLTVICDGRLALPFTKAYLDAFEAFTTTTHEHEADRRAAAVIAECTASDDGTTGRLSACAGVAIVKPHHPFTQAYALAEELLVSAKVVKRVVHVADGEGRHRSVPCSALDVHVLLDSAASDLEHVRGELTHRDGSDEVRLYARPIITTPVDWLADLRGTVRDWVHRRHWDRLLARVRAIARGRGRPERGGPGVPRSQVYDLRQAALTGRRRGEERFAELRTRYGVRALAPLGNVAALDADSTPDAVELFWLEALEATPANQRGVFVTAIADALALADHLPAGPAATATGRAP